MLCIFPLLDQPAAWSFTPDTAHTHVKMLFNLQTKTFVDKGPPIVPSRHNMKKRHILPVLLSVTYQAGSSLLLQGSSPGSKYSDREEGESENEKQTRRLSSADLSIYG